MTRSGPNGTDTACTLQFIGNATMLLRLGPFTVLTDPNFLHRGQWAYLGHGLVSKRRTDPALSVDQVPPLDAIVLSHMHGDHWDRVAKRGLPRDVPILTTGKAAAALRRQGFSASTALPTWESETLRRAGHTVTVTATPGRHATGPARHLLPPVMGSVVDYGTAGGPVLRLYISGDTLSSTTCARYRTGSPTSTSRRCTSAAPRCRAACWSRWTPARAPICSS